MSNGFRKLRLPKFHPGEAVCLITIPHRKEFVHSVTIFEDSCTYLLWDWTNQFVTYHEWQIQSYDD